MTNVFKSASKNLKDASEKHFNNLMAYFPINQTNILNENQFADLTFEMGVLHVNRIHNKAFGKTAETLIDFSCVACSIEHSPPNHDLWKTISQLTKANSLTLNVNVTEIPENMITPPNGTESQMQKLWFYHSYQKMTVKAGAFQNLNQIQRINLWEKFNKIEKGAFRFNKKSDTRLIIAFNSKTNFTADVFKNGTFNGIQRPVTVFFELKDTFLNYLPEGSFKAILDQNKENKVRVYDDIYQTTINCEDCRNYWLIRDDRREQITAPTCSSNFFKHLFDNDVAAKLKAKCAKLY